MKLINNDKEFKKFYPYKCPPNKEPCPELKDYPKRYPCFCEVVDEDDGGMGGPLKWVDIKYPPTGCDLKSFKAGLEAR